MSGWLLQGLEEGVGGLQVEAVRFQEDVDLGARLVRTVDGVEVDVGDLFLADEVALRRHDLHIGMEALLHPRQVVQAPQPAVGTGQPRGEGQGGLGLAHPGRTEEQIGVRRPLLERPGEDGDGHLLPDDVSEQTPAPRLPALMAEQL